ncbi:MAG: hypothetical protein KAV87_22460 [Desulfobacteraceae bacterium]|nr:hypothetical protein [Desulfobacteraceae bacterium]
MTTGGLGDLDPTTPAGNSLLSLGDDAIRIITAKLIEFAAIEHALTGEHTFGVGPVSSRPAAGFKGRVYILTVASVAAELQYDTGAAWVTITSNQAVINYATGLASHINATTIDHPDGSVTNAKIIAGAILKRHLMGGTSADSIAALVNGGNADLLHSHTVAAESGATGMTVYDTAGAHVLIVPAGVVRMYFTLVGGGGAGGAGYSIKAGGGGAAGTVIWNAPLAVTGGEELDLYVGSGGLSNNAYSTTGGNGENSTVERLVMYGSGGPGGYGGYASASGMSGGVAINGMIETGSGGRGEYAPVFGGGDVSSSNGGSTLWFSGGSGNSGGGGGASHLGPGAAGGSVAQGGLSADSASAAGGGGGGVSAQTWGGNGGSGLIIVTW